MNGYFFFLVLIYLTSWNVPSHLAYSRRVIYEWRWATYHEDVRSKALHANGGHGSFEIPRLLGEVLTYGDEIQVKCSHHSKASF